MIDDISGAPRITNHFKSLYENLYNEQNEVNIEMKERIDRSVGSNIWDAQDIVSLFTIDLVKSAVQKLKPDKSDVSGMFTSDCLKAAPDIFFERLAHLFRLFLVHGHVSLELLVCALCPIVKDPNGDISSSKNYRGIALSSLIL